MINQSLNILMLYLTLLITAIGRDQVSVSQPATAFKQADKAYQKDATEGFRQFSLLYRQAITKHDRITELKCLNIFTEYFWTQHNFPLALSWGLKAISLAEQLRSDELAGDASILTGLIHNSAGDYLEAVSYYQRGIDHYQVLPKSKRLALAYMDMGVSERKVGRFETANACYFKAANLFRQFNDMDGLASVYTAIGNCFASMENYTQAIPYHSKALSIFIQLRDIDGKARVLTNLGYSYKQKNEPDSAITYLVEAVRLRSTTSDSSLKVIPLQNLGSAWKQKGQDQKAVGFIRRSIVIAEKYHMDDELARGQVDLAELFFTQRRYDEACKLLAIAEVTCERLKLADLLVTISELNYQVQAAQGHDRLALIYYQKRDRVRDSLFTTQKDRAIEDMDIKYKTSERERDIADLHTRDQLSQKILNQQRLSITALVTGALLLLALLLFAFYSFRMQKIANLQVKNLMHELQHRTKNNLQILSSILMLQIESQEDENIKSALQETEVRLNTMNIVYSKLYTGQTTSTIDMAVYLTALLDHIRDSFNYTGRQISIVKEFDPFLFHVDKAVIIGLIVNELTTNAIRHAIGKTGVTVTVKLKTKNAKMIVLSVNDNGQLASSTLKKENISFGLRIVTLMASQLHGVLKTRPENPFAYELFFRM